MKEVLDASAIQKQLQSLRQERQQERERLSSINPGRGRGSGPWGGRGPGGPPPPGRPTFLASRLGSTPSGPLHRGDSGAFGRPFGGGLDRALSGGSARSDPDGGGTLIGRKRLLSAVVVDGEARTALPRADNPMTADGSPANGGGYDDRFEEGPAPKRPTRELPAADAKRSRRLLGGLLLGTLAKFREEDAAFRASRVAHQRQEVERRATEKAEAEAQRLKEEARKERAQRRTESLSKLRTINLQSELLMLELRAAKAIERQRQLSAFLCTAPTSTSGDITARGAVLWLPKAHNDATAALAAARAEEFERLQEAALKQLEADKQAAQQLAEARAEEASKRFAERQAARAAQGEADQAGVEEEGEEDEAAEAGGSEHDGDAMSDGAAPSSAVHENGRDAGHEAEGGGAAEPRPEARGGGRRGPEDSGVEDSGGEEMEPDYEEDGAGYEPGSVEDLLR